MFLITQQRTKINNSERTEKPFLTDIQQIVLPYLISKFEN